MAPAIDLRAGSHFYLTVRLSGRRGHTPYSLCLLHLTDVSETHGRREPSLLLSEVHFESMEDGDVSTQDHNKQQLCQNSVLAAEPIGAGKGISGQPFFLCHCSTT